MKKVFTILFLFVCFESMAQRDALYYQYLLNYHILNPAYTGALEKMTASVVNRNQWVGIKGAPHTVTFDIHSPIRNDKIALGLYIYSDRLGPWTNFGMISTYAYRIDMGKGKLSFGLQFGFKQISVDWDLILMEHMDDYYLLTRPQSKILPDANFGFYYATDNFFVGLSSKHLFDRAFAETGSENSTNFGSLGYHFYTYIGGYIRFGKNVIYKPSVLVKYVDKGTFNFDFNSAVMLKNLIWVGVSFKSATNSVVITTELKLNSKYRIGYSYDSYLGDVGAYNIGSHEIKISYEVDLYKRRNSFPLSF